MDSPIYDESELSGDEKRPQMKMSIQLAWEPEEIADDIDRMIEEGGKHCSEQLSLKAERHYYRPSPVWHTHSSMPIREKPQTLRA
jgi:hypothetical protein